MPFKKIDLLLVNPGDRSRLYGDLSVSFAGIEPPIWCGLIAAFIREHGYSVEIIDAEAQNWDPEYTAERIAEYNPLLVGIIVLGTNPAASSTPKMTAVNKTVQALKIKAPHVKVMLGGLHPSALPERTLREEKVDFVCQGEGFYTILELLEILKSDKHIGTYKIRGLWYLKDGKVISSPPAHLINNLDELPFVAWDLLPMNKYRAHNWHCFNNPDQRQSYAVIYTSMGCPFNCRYCPIHALYGKPGIRFRSPEKVVEEIDLLVKNYDIKNIKILDELFAIKEERVIRICDLIISRGYNLNLWAYARIDTVKESMLKKMKKAGINWVAFGIESASIRVRNDIDKKIEQDRIKEVVRMTQAIGINIIGNFIFGLYEDDLNTMQETLNLAKELNFEYVNFYVAMAYPCSQLYLDALQKNIKLPKHWHGYSQYSAETLPLPTKYLSSSEVLRFRDKAFEEYFSNPEYLEMVRKKFGSAIVEQINEMLKYRMRRKYA